MDSNTWIIVVGILGNICGSFLYLSPAPTFWRIVKKKSIEEFSCIPYVILLMNASIWAYYGFISPKGLLLITVSGFGATVQSIYVLIFLIFAPRKLKVRTLALVLTLNVGFMVALIVITRLVLSPSAQLKVIGIMVVIINIVTFASPLIAMRTVVRTRSVEYMPFFLSLGCFLVGLIWTVYAVLTRDIFIGIPNVTGLALGVCQLVLYAVYRNAKPLEINLDDEKPPKIIAEDALEKGFQHQIPSSK